MKFVVRIRMSDMTELLVEQASGYTNDATVSQVKSLRIRPSGCTRLSTVPVTFQQPNKEQHG